MSEQVRVEVIDPGGHGQSMGTLWAWVAVHGPGDESIVAVLQPNGTAMPLVAQQEATIRAYRDVVQAAAAASGKPARLMRYSTADVVDEVHP